MENWLSHTILSLQIVGLRTDRSSTNCNMNTTVISNSNIFRCLSHDIVQLYVHDRHTLDKVKGLLERKEPNVNMTWISSSVGRVTINTSVWGLHSGNRICERWDFTRTIVPQTLVWNWPYWKRGNAELVNVWSFRMGFFSIYEKWNDIASEGNPQQARPV